MGTDILYIKTGHICKDTAKDVETRSDASNYELWTTSERKKQSYQCSER